MTMTTATTTTTATTRQDSNNGMQRGRQPGAGRGCIGAGEGGKACKEVDNGEEMEEKS